MELQALSSGWPREKKYPRLLFYSPARKTPAVCLAMSGLFRSREKPAAIQALRHTPQNLPANFYTVNVYSNRAI